MKINIELILIAYTDLAGIEIYCRIEHSRQTEWQHTGTVLYAQPRSAVRLRQVFPGAAVGCMYEQAVWCGIGGSRRTALLIGFHRLRPANSEHQWAETDWASWVTKSRSSPSLICQKKCISHSPGKCFRRGTLRFWVEKKRRMANVTSDFQSLLLWSENLPRHYVAIYSFCVFSSN